MKSNLKTTLSRAFILLLACLLAPCVYWLMKSSDLATSVRFMPTRLAWLPPAAQTGLIYALEAVTIFAAAAVVSLPAVFYGRFNPYFIASALTVSVFLGVYLKWILFWIGFDSMALIGGAVVSLTIYFASCLLGSFLIRRKLSPRQLPFSR